MSGIDDQPLLVLNRVGKGRTAELLSDQIWLWSRGYEGGGPQAELLRRVAHWLMKEPDLEEEDLRASVVDGRIEIVRRSLNRQAGHGPCHHAVGQQGRCRSEGPGRWAPDRLAWR